MSEAITCENTKKEDRRVSKETVLERALQQGMQGNIQVMQNVTQFYYTEQVLSIEYYMNSSFYLFVRSKVDELVLAVQINQISNTVDNGVGNME